MTPWDSGQDDAEVYRPALIRGRYRVTRVLHRGRRSDVVVAYDNREGGEVVLKRVIEPSRSDITRLRTAHRTLSGLHDPHVMGTHELIEARADAWLVCDHVPGSALIKWWTALPLGSNASYEERWRHAAPVVAGLLDAIEALHARQTAHLDIKPHNVLVGRAGDVHLVDVGLWPAPAGIDTRPMSEIQERSGYAAPELIAGLSDSRRCDQWSLGAIVYELLTGQKALPGQTPVEFDRAYAVGRVQPVNEWLPDIDPHVSAAVQRLLSWDPEERFPTLAAVRDAFGNTLGAALATPTEVWSAPRPPMIGRETLDAFFRRRLLDLRHRKGCVIRVVDGPGTGKTRLLRRWSRQANQDRQIQVLSATCLPGRPRTALHRWFRPRAVDPNGPPPQDLVEQAMEQLDQPTVLLLDALEEVDSTVWARIQRATAIAIDGWAPKALIVVLSGRALGGLTPVVDENSDRLFNVALPPLGAAQLEGILRPESETPEARERLDNLITEQLSASGGNPRALTQGLLAAERAGKLIRRGRFWAPRAGGAPVRDPLLDPPERLEQILGYLDELGSCVEIELALACLPMARGHLLQVLRWASATHVVSYREFGGRWFMQLSDRSERPAVELVERQATHARAAQWSECNGEFGGLAAERTAEHWHQAGEHGRTADAYERAAKAHAGVGSSSDARRLFALARTFDSRRTRTTTPGASPLFGTTQGFKPTKED